MAFQISLIFEACPNLLTLVPPKQPVTKAENLQSSLSLVAEGGGSTELNNSIFQDLSGDSKKDLIDPSQFPFEPSSVLDDCPSFCASRLRSRYLDRLPGWKKRIIASLRPFGLIDQINHDLSGGNLNRLNHSNFIGVVNGHRTRSAAAAASQRINSNSVRNNSSLVSTTTKNGNNDVDLTVNYAKVTGVLLNKNKKKQALTGRASNRSVILDDMTVVQSDLELKQIVRGRRKRSGTNPNMLDVNKRPNVNRSVQVTLSNEVITSSDIKFQLKPNQSFQPISNTSNQSNVDLTTIDSMLVPFLTNASRAEAIKHTLSQLPHYLLTQDHINSLLSNIPKVILSSNPMFWTPIDLASYLGGTDCREMWPWLAAEAVDGQAFMLLTLPVLHRLVGLRWDDAIRLARHVISVKQAFVEQFGQINETVHPITKTR